MYPGSRSRVKPLHLQQQLADEQDGVPPDERVRVLQAGGHGGNVPVHHRRVPCLCALDDWRYIGSRRGRCVALRVRVRVRVRKGREGRREGLLSCFLCQNTLRYVAGRLHCRTKQQKEDSSRVADNVPTVRKQAPCMDLLFEHAASTLDPPSPKSEGKKRKAQ